MRETIVLAAALAAALTLPATGAAAQGGTQAPEKAGSTRPQPRPKPPTLAEARAALDRFETSWRGSGNDLPSLAALARSRAIRRLAAVDHRLVARRLLSLLEDRRPRVRLEAIGALAGMKRNARAVVPALRRLFAPDDAPPEETVRILGALGALGAKGLSRECVKLFTHKEDRVALAAVAALGGMGDRKVLPGLLELFELNILDPSRGITVRVDTDAEGSGDARAARAKGRRLEKLRRIPIRGKMLAAIRKTLFQLTGERFDTPQGLRDWMDAHGRLWR